MLVYMSRIGLWVQYRSTTGTGIQSLYKSIRVVYKCYMGSIPVLYELDTSLIRVNTGLYELNTVEYKSIRVEYS